MSAPIRIGLTGGIGAGKSTVSARLKRLGAMVLDADVAARQVVEPGTEGLKKLTARYGGEILTDKGELDRVKLAHIIFGSEEERLAVNFILHPLVGACMRAQESVYRVQEPEGPIFYDVPLLIESGMHRDMDEVWLVTADEAARVRRVMLRDGCTEEEAHARIIRQMPEDEKRRYADRVIDNSGGQAALFRRVDALYRKVSGQGTAERIGH